MKFFIRLAPMTLMTGGVLCFVIGAIVARQSGSREVIVVDGLIRRLGQVVSGEAVPLHIVLRNPGVQLVRIIGAAPST